MPAAVAAFSTLTLIGGKCACRTVSPAIRTAFVFVHELREPLINSWCV